MTLMTSKLSVYSYLSDRDYKYFNALFYPCSDSTGSGTDDDEEEEKEKKEKLIPEWARGTRLREALERQWGLDGSTPMDPDLIFPEVQTCNLEEIFGVKKGINRV